MPCYFVARIDVHDREGYARYLAGTGPLLERFGATVLAVDEDAVVLEGEWPGNRTVLLSFPDQAAARAWYDSPEYRAIAEHRHAASTGEAVLVIGGPARPEELPVITTPRLTLSALTAEDAPRLLEYRSDPRVREFQSFDPHGLADAERFIADAASGASGWRQFGMRVVEPGGRASGAGEPAGLAGDIGYRLSAERGQAEIGVTVAPERQGEGFASEAVTALLAHLFGELEVHRVHASVDPRNAPSMRLFERLGFRKEAHMRESVLARGEWADDVVFAMLCREWSPTEA